VRVIAKRFPILQAALYNEGGERNPIVFRSPVPLIHGPNLPKKRSHRYAGKGMVVDQQGRITFHLRLIKRFAIPCFMFYVS
jgi:hypothetical protein